MKKIFALLLACVMLFLTACNGASPSESTTSNTPGNSQNQDPPNESELKDTIIKDSYDDFIDTPSRILFVNPITPKYTFYYSKVDGKAYVYCFDPLCDHSGGKCLAEPWDFGETTSEFDLYNTFFINNRFYTATRHGQIYSFSFDGSDLKIEYGPKSFTIEELNMLQVTWSPNFCAYDKYIYIPMNADENGNPCILRFNVETKEMENLTEKTGNCILPDFFYNGELYGREFPIGDYYKANLDLSEAELVDSFPVVGQFYGSVFFDNAYDDPTDYKNRKTIGIQAYDMKTGGTKIMTNEMLELEANPYTVVAVDENYIYFYQNKQILIGTYIDPKGKEREQYKYNDGKLYRVKHDGTDCTLIYDNPNFEFNSREAVICGNQIIVDGSEYAVGADGYVVCTFSGMQVGTIGLDGKIDKFEMIELIY